MQGAIPVFHFILGRFEIDLLLKRVIIDSLLNTILILTNYFDTSLCRQRKKQQLIEVVPRDRYIT